MCVCLCIYVSVCVNVCAGGMLLDVIVLIKSAVTVVDVVLNPS